MTPGGTITTVAGNGNGGYSGDGGPATSAELFEPYGVVVDGAGNLYIADTINNSIRKVTPGGTITTVAGDGTYGYSGDGGPATSAELAHPYGVAVDGAGNLYIADADNQRIRKVTPGGTITTVAGGTYGYSGDGGPATSAELYEPTGVAVDGAGNLYIADSGNQRIRKVDVSDAPSLTFPSTNVGDASAAQDVSVLNLGNAPLDISQISTATNFSLGGTDTSCSSSGQTLNAAESCILGIEFNPLSAGSISGSVVLTDDTLNASAATQSIGLSGTALVPVASISPGSLTFGAQDAGTTSTLQTVTLNNTGLGTLIVNSVAIGNIFENLPNPNFSETDNCVGSVAAGSFCTINVTFSPSAAGLVSGVLIVTDNSNGVSGSTQTVSLSGTGDTYNGYSPMLTTLYNFCSQLNCADGTGPGSPLIQGPDGNLYGTNASGIADGVVGLGGGTVFRMTPQGAITTLHTFCSQPNCSDGYIYPNGVGNGSLMLASDGNFYGTTYFGGANPGPSNCAVGNCSGTVFRMTPGGSLTTLYSFCAQANCTDGSQPVGLVQARDGNFYGATENGGANNQGTFFRITPSGTLTTLYNFCSQTNCTDGGEPMSAPIQGTDGNFYGTTYNGGTANYGTVFKITPTGTLTTLYSGTGQNDEYPTGPLVQGTDGNFYGTAVRGDVFKITPQGELTILSGTENGYPYAGLIQASDGNFYGTFYVGDDGGVSESDSCVNTYSGLRLAFPNYTRGIADGAIWLLLPGQLQRWLLSHRGLDAGDKRDPLWHDYRRRHRWSQFRSPRTRQRSRYFL